MGIIIEPKPGTYTLILSCASDARIQVGRLGTMQLQRGITFTWGARWGLVACVPGSPTIKRCPHDHIGISTT